MKSGKEQNIVACWWAHGKLGKVGSSGRKLNLSNWKYLIDSIKNLYILERR